MKTIHSLSGGKTSSYMAVHYPADYNIFALVMIDDLRCKPIDKGIVKYASDKLGLDFIATAESDSTIYAMRDLEQLLGKEIIWVAGKSFDKLNKKKSAAGSDIQEAIKLLEEAKALQGSSSPADNKIYNEKIAKAYQLAGGAIDQAKAAAGFVDKTGLSPDLQKEMDTAQQKTKQALDTFYADTDTAMQYIANGGEKGWDILLTGMSDASKKYLMMLQNL